MTHRRRQSRAIGRVAIAATVALAAVVATPVAADARQLSDGARAAIASGSVRPLTELAALARSRGAEILDVDLYESNGRWVYAVRVLTRAGRVVDLDLDAQTLEQVR